jgi:hypothetical protein
MRCYSHDSGLYFLHSLRLPAVAPTRRGEGWCILLRFLLAGRSVSRRLALNARCHYLLAFINELDDLLLPHHTNHNAKPIN